MLLGISDLVIGVTIVAVGTSLPELAVSIVAVRKGLHGLALGNIIGSNAFNMLAVIGVAAVPPSDSRWNQPTLSLHLKVMLGVYGGILLHGVQLHGNHARESYREVHYC